MRAFALVVLIIGLALGVISGLLQIITVAFGDSLMEAVNSNQNQLSTQLLQARESLKKATDKTIPHILTIVGYILTTVAGGAFGFLAASSDTKKPWKTAFGGATVAAGLGLLAFRSWVVAIAYVLAGFLLIVLSDRQQDVKDTPEESK